VTSSELSEGVDISVFFAATTNHSSLIFTKLWLISAPLFASIADPATKRGRILPPTLVRFETQFAFRDTSFRISGNATEEAVKPTESCYSQYLCFLWTL
jgi:hypothetical protein